MPEVPRNVELQVEGSHSVRMTWDAPRPTEAEINGYIIYWSKGEAEQDAIIVRYANEHKFTGLEQGQSIAASVCAFSGETISKDRQFTGPCSERLQLNLPDMEEGCF